MRFEFCEFMFIDKNTHLFEFQFREEVKTINHKLKN